MKKVLIASTALVAASLMYTGAAQASEKIKLELGGYSKWWVVGAWQDDNFQSNNNAAGAQGDYNSVDIKGDNEIFFGGSTTLDNGLKVGISVELEAGGNTGAGAGDATDTIDKSFVFVEGGFGKFIVGTEANGTALLHVMAPDAAGNTDSDGMLTGGLAIVKPTNNSTQVVTSIDTDGDAEKITYVSPTFYGLTVGGSYVPNTKQDDRGATNISTSNTAVTAGEIYGVGALYAKTFGGVDLKVSGGWVTYALNGSQVATPQAENNVDEYSTGAQLSYAGFTVGGSYRNIAANGRANSLDGQSWDAGVQYASGPYAVSFIYFESKQNADVALAGDDTATIYQVSGKYSMGPGVDVLATIGHAEYEDEAGLAKDENKGWAVMTGLSLAF